MKVLKIYSKFCGPCKVLEKNLQLANIPYESIDIQTESGEKFVDKYSIKTIPTLIILDDGGNVLKKHSGLLSVQELKKFYNEAD